MANWQKRSLTKKTGGKTRRFRKSKKFERGSEFTATEVGEERTETEDARGNTVKCRVRRSEEVNLAKNGEVVRTGIESVVDNPANQNYVRRSLLTKGTIVQTPEGKAEITSRPGQDGNVNARLVE